MNSFEIQQKIKETFEKNFGYTPLNERLNDISRETNELIRFLDVKNIKEEAGDLLCSLIQLHTENDWDISENIEKTLLKINSRYNQYKSLGRKAKVALYGGAFNPITKGHIQVAQFILNIGEFDEVWLVPTYKHMYNKQMVSPEHRINMCNIASKIDGRIKIFDYEIKNELSGESYYLIKRLKLEEELNKCFNFSLVIGLDNANTFDKWVNYQELERMIRMVVVPRKGYKSIDNAWYFKEPHIFLSDNDSIMEVSSTEVRNRLEKYYKEPNIESIPHLLDIIDPMVFKYIIDNNLYNG